MKDYISLSFSFNLSDLGIIIIIIIIQVVVILTGFITVLYAVKSRASYTEIGNKKDYISWCDLKFHATPKCTTKSNLRRRFTIYINKFIIYLYVNI